MSADTRPRIKDVSNMPFEDEWMWYLWCAYVRWGGIARKILKIFREERRAKISRLLMEAVEAMIRNSANKVSRKMCLTFSSVSLPNDRSHDVIVTRPAASGKKIIFVFCLDRKTRHWCL